ncbi:MAG: polysaccharide biosynthesis/export family protein [Gemmataceae bacterium]|nr:polysaccharide biosynthesis/export family protein [Gemmataceae bacterium]
MWLLLALLASAQTGCSCRQLPPPSPVPDLPRELSKVRLHDYVIEPPDILLIDAVSVVPKPPYRVSSGDILLVQVIGAFETEPIAGPFPVEPEGTINLGPSYGLIQVVGLTVPEIREKVTKHLGEIVKNPKVFVGLGQSRALQQIRGQHLVSPDGKVRLGLYGEVTVAGLTVAQAKQAIQQHLSYHLQNPEVSLDVAAYNSKVIYVVFDGAGNGQQIQRLPVTGNDTVLDALAQVGGLTAVSNPRTIWVARPGAADAPCDQILPVDWVGITSAGRTATNYQLLPGDRIYVKSQALIRIDTALSKVFAPVERIFGITLLGNSVFRSFRNSGGGGAGNNAGGLGRF